MWESISYAKTGWRFMMARSLPARGPRLRRMRSGTPILPISCRTAPRYICSCSSGLTRIARARCIVTFVTRCVCPFRLPISQIEGARPAFEGGVVRRVQLAQEEHILLAFVQQCTVAPPAGPPCAGAV